MVVPYSGCSSKDIVCLGRAHRHRGEDEDEEEEEEEEGDFDLMSKEHTINQTNGALHLLGVLLVNCKAALQKHLPTLTTCLYKLLFHPDESVVIFASGAIGRLPEALGDEFVWSKIAAPKPLSKVMKDAFTDIVQRLIVNVTNALTQ